MKRRLVALLLILSFGLAPLAQAVDCVMQTTMAPDCPMMQDRHDAMPVVDCFSALKNGVMPLATAMPELPSPLLAVLPERRLPVVQVAEVLPPRTAPLRAPPDDILRRTARMRI